MVNILTIGGKSDDELFVIGINNPFYNNDITPTVNGNEDYIKITMNIVLKLMYQINRVVTSGMHDREIF